MKKEIVLAIIVTHGMCALAHQSMLNGSKHADVIPKELREIPVNHIIQSAPFFSEDFNSGIPGSWTNVDNSGNNVLWRTTASGALNQSSPVDYQLNPNGTSAANGYLILDSDSAGPAATENSDLTTVAINCSGHSNVHLAFNEYFAQYGASTAAVKVSNDNITWVDVHHAETGLSMDMGTANPYALDIDISATAANQATVYIRFNYQGAYDYWWFVDDVQLYEPSSTDLAANTIGKLNEEYTSIPLGQATSLHISAEIKNVGLAATNGGTALLELVDVGGGLTVFSESVNLSSLSPGATQVVTPSTSFAPPVAGVYKSRVTVNIAGDGNLTNDQLESATIEISDSVYSRDDGNFVSTLGIGAGPGEDGIEGQNFSVNAAGDISSVTFFFDDTLGFNPTGTAVYFSVRPQLNDTTPPDSSVIAYSDTMVFLPGTVPVGGSFYTLHISGGPVHVLQGLYFIGLHEVDSLLPIGFTSNIITPGAVWVHWNSIPSPSGWGRPEDFGFQLTYMLRANFTPASVYVDDIMQAKDLLLYPNPTSGIVNLRWDGQAEKTMITVINTVGQAVYSEESRGNSATMNLNLPPGIYFIRLSSAFGSVMKKFILTSN